MDAYERSLKQQAERIRRELSQEGKKNAPAPKPEPTGEFIPSDVPSPIYGYARPKPKINLPTEHSPETRDDLSIHQSEPHLDSETSTTPASEEMTVDEPLQATESFVPEELDVVVEESVEIPFVVEESVSAEHQTAMETEESNISPETSDRIEISSVEPKPLLGEVSILEDGFASVFMGSTQLKTSKIVVREEKEEATSTDVSIEVTSIEEVAPVVEHVAKTLQAGAEEPKPAFDEAELTPAVNVSYKADSPPLNVMMTPQDRMAMYRSRRLAQKKQ